MTDADRIKRQLYAIARSITRNPPPGVERIRINQLSSIIELAMPEPGEPDPWSAPGSRGDMLMTDGLPPFKHAPPPSPGMMQRPGVD